MHFLFPFNLQARKSKQIILGMRKPVLAVINWNGRYFSWKSSWILSYYFMRKRKEEGNCC